MYFYWTCKHEKINTPTTSQVQYLRICWIRQLVGDHENNLKLWSSITLVRETKWYKIKIKILAWSVIWLRLHLRIVRNSFKSSLRLVLVWRFGVKKSSSNVFFLLTKICLHFFGYQARQRLFCLIWLIRLFSVTISSWRG